MTHFVFLFGSEWLGGTSILPNRNIQMVSHLLWHRGFPSKTGGEWQNGFWSKSGYRGLLVQVFSKCSAVLKDDATIWIRTDARDYTFQVTSEVLREIFPKRLTVKINVTIWSSVATVSE